MIKSYNSNNNISSPGKLEEDYSNENNLICSLPTKKEDLESPFHTDYFSSQETSPESKHSTPFKMGFCKDNSFNY